jgi:hypothetical protein
LAGWKNFLVLLTVASLASLDKKLQDSRVPRCLEKEQARREPLPCQRIEK